MPGAGSDAGGKREKWLMSQWDSFLQTVETGAAKAARNALQGYEAEATADARAFVTAMDADLKTWTAELANQQITADDMESYVQADAALATMAALTQAGIAAATLQRFRDALIDVVVTAATSTFLPK